ncbi:hypothetical protein J2Z60_002142 [Lactobacillus colini]|uniref:Uncharacterized protein n=1 Tax=Lactobacillus colini TaxID=1819254 RepID=A0ABS4MHY0_9LACO|nr:hypothetical protein [Lactobacillus colini]MBP2058951.1 hypothetical protein [Lactobacillus colini]
MKTNRKPLTLNEKRLIAALHEGKEHAKNAKELAIIIGVDKRTIVSLVKSSRNKGYLIGSSHKQPYSGYYMITTMEEFNQTVNGLNSARKHMTNTLNGLAKGFQDTFGISLLEAPPLRKKVK